MSRINFEKYEAIFFDLDGTLIDSMLCHYNIWSKILSKYNKKISKNKFYLNEGNNIYELMKSLTGINDNQEIKKIISEKDKLFSEFYKFTLFDGVHDLLNHVKKNDILISGLVTASSKERYEKTCPKWFKKYFSVIVTSEDGGRGKPYPDPYINAALKASVKPKNVLVIENSPYGIISAKDAGMDTVGVGHTVSTKKLQNANYVYKNIYEFYKGLIYENK